MNDKRKLYTILILIYFMVTYMVWISPSHDPSTQPQTQVQQTVQQQPQVQGVAVQPVPATPVVSIPRPSSKQLRDSPQTVINSGTALFTVNHLGGRIQSVKLKGYKAKLNDDTPYEMVSTKEGAPLPLGIYADGVNDDFVLYALDTTSLPELDGSMYHITNVPVNFVLKGQLATGTNIKKILTFTPGSYAVGVSVELSSPSHDGNPVRLEWGHVVPATELADIGMLMNVSALGSDNKLHSTFIRDLKLPSVQNGEGAWIAIYDYYFIESIVSLGEKSHVESGLENETYFVRMSGNANGGNFLAYAGPKDIETLRVVGHSLDRSIDLGWFSVLAQPILILVKLFYRLLGNYGLSIILLTLLIKLFFLPLTQSSFKSMQAMQELQPEIAALRERIEDQNVLNQETMALYKKRGVNPLGGCFPVLIQVPVFLGLYNALRNSIDLRHEPFALWITDLSAPEHLQVFGVGIPLMILIMGASMLVQQWTQPSAMDPQQKKIMMLMPFIFTFMFIIHPMPSGLVLYWLVNNLISIVQQKYIRGHKGGSPLKATAYASLAMFCFGYVLTLL